jgi:hypothetical protein
MLEHISKHDNVEFAQRFDPLALEGTVMHRYASRACGRDAIGIRLDSDEHNATCVDEKLRERTCAAAYVEHA